MVLSEMITSIRRHLWIYLPLLSGGPTCQRVCILDNLADWVERFVELSGPEILKIGRVSWPSVFSYPPNALM